MKGKFIRKRLLSTILAVTMINPLITQIGGDYKSLPIITAEAVEDDGGEKVAQFDMDNHALMLRADGRLLGWGDNQYGQLGLGKDAEKKYNSPIEITFFKDKAPVKQVVCYEDASMILLEDGKIYTCGKGDNGRLGVGSLVSKNTWTLIPNSDKLFVSKLYKGTACVYGVTMDDTLLALGKNDEGQLGTGDKEDRLVFTKVLDHADVKQFEAGEDFAVLFQQDGDMLCTGNNANNRYCNGSFCMTPKESMYVEIPLGGCNDYKYKGKTILSTKYLTISNKGVYNPSNSSYNFGSYHGAINKINSTKMANIGIESDTYLKNPVPTLSSHSYTLWELEHHTRGDYYANHRYSETDKDNTSKVNAVWADLSQMLKVEDNFLDDIVETDLIGKNVIPQKSEGSTIRVLLNNENLLYNGITYDTYEIGDNDKATVKRYIDAPLKPSLVFEKLYLPVKLNWINPYNSEFSTTKTMRDISSDNMRGMKVLIDDRSEPISSIPTKLASSAPICYPNADDTYHIQYGNKHSILEKDGMYYTSGDDSQKQLLDNASSLIPIELKTLNDKIANLKLMEYNSFDVKVAGDANYFFASNPISKTLDAYAWGGNTRGKLGIGSTRANTAELTEIPELKNKPVETIVKGRNSVAFLLEDGGLMMCGDNLYGTLGLGDDYANKAIVTSPVLNENIKFSFTAEPPEKPEIPAETETPKEAEAGKPFKVEWKPVKEAKEYELSRTVTVDGEEKVDTAMMNGDLIGTKVLAAVTDTEVIYKGADTYFEDTINPDWDSVEYAVKALNFVGDSSDSVHFPTITVKEPEPIPKPDDDKTSEDDKTPDGGETTDTTPPALNYIPNPNNGQINFMATDNVEVEGIYINNVKQGIANCLYYLTSSEGVITAYAKDKAGNQSLPLLIKYTDIVTNTDDDDKDKSSSITDENIDIIKDLIDDMKDSNNSNNSVSSDDLNDLEDKLIRYSQLQTNKTSSGMTTSELISALRTFNSEDKSFTPDTASNIVDTLIRQMPQTSQAPVVQTPQVQTNSNSNDELLKTMLMSSMINQLSQNDNDEPKSSGNDDPDSNILFIQAITKGYSQMQLTNYILLVVLIIAVITELLVSLRRNRYYQSESPMNQQSKSVNKFRYEREPEDDFDYQRMSNWKLRQQERPTIKWNEDFSVEVEEPQQEDTDNLLKRYNKQNSQE